MVWIFCLALASTALPGVVWRGGSSSNNFYAPSGAARFCPRIFIFTRYIVQQLGHSLFLASYICPIWTPWGLANFCTLAVLWVFAMLLRGLPLIFPYIWRFWRGSEVVWGTWCLLPRNLVLRIRPDYIGYLPLVAGFPPPFGRYCLVAFLWDHLDPVVPFW